MSANEDPGAPANVRVAFWPTLTGPVGAGSFALGIPYVAASRLRAMVDLVMVVLTVGFFVLAGLFMIWLEKI